MMKHKTRSKLRDTSVTPQMYTKLFKISDTRILWLHLIDTFNIREREAMRELSLTSATIAMQCFFNFLFSFTKQNAVKLLNPVCPKWVL